jgi:hypothetical protein
MREKRFARKLENPPGDKIYLTRPGSNPNFATLRSLRVAKKYEIGVELWETITNEGTY